MKTTTALVLCLLCLTSCETPKNYRGPSIGLSFGYDEFSVALTLFSSPAPAAAILDVTPPEPTKPGTVTVQK